MQHKQIITYIRHIEVETIHNIRKETYREVGVELGTDSTVGSVGTHHLTPDHSELRAGHGLLGLVDISNLLAKVESAALLIVHAVQGEEGGVVVGVGETSAENHEKISELQLRSNTVLLSPEV